MIPPLFANLLRFGCGTMKNGHLRNSILPTLAAILMIGAMASAAPKWGLFDGHPIVRVVVNGRQIDSDVPAINLNGRTMVPLRFVSEALGANVSWNDEEQTAVVTTGQSTLPPGNSSVLKVMIATEKEDGAPTKTGEEFPIRTNPELYLYFEAWDDGKPHTWKVTWTSKEGRIYKEASVQPTRRASKDVPDRIYGYDSFRLQVPLARDQAMLPDAGVFYVTLYRDGVEVAKLPFWLTR